MADFGPSQQEIQNIVDATDNTVSIVDGVNPALKATVNASGELKVIVTGGGSAGQLVQDGQAVVGTDVGRLSVGTDGSNYQVLKTDASGELQIDVLTLPAIPAGTNNIGDVDVLTLPNVTLASQASPFTNDLKITLDGELVDVSDRANRDLGKVDIAGFDVSLPAGTNNIGDVDVVSSVLPTGAATAANQATEITSLQLIDDLPNLDAGLIAGAKGVGILGSDGTNFRWLKVDANGSLVTAASPTSNIFFRFGNVQTAAIALAAVRGTAYTEQTTNAQRSIASANANDTAAGTGARTVIITYYDVTGAGPFTETVTLNGVTYVNTVATNICYIEKIEVVTVGSTGSNVGILTLKATTAGGGATIGTVAATQNTTLWAHHYIPTGASFKLTGMSCGHNGTTVGSGGLFILRSKPIGVANVPEVQISDFVRLYGQSSTFARAYNSPITVMGPAVVTMYVTPETATSTNYRGAFDFFEE
jgi:hypothetical protein